MKRSLKAVKYLIAPVAALVVVLAWVTYYHNDWVTGHVPKFLHDPLTHLGQKTDAAAVADEDPDPNKNDIPVHVGKITVATLHQYIEGMGQVAPRPARAGETPGSANVVAPVAGVVAKVVCQLNGKVRAGDVLVQLDDRLAASAEAQAQAALAQEQAALAVLLATPRPEQLAIDQLAIDKAQTAVEFAQKNYERQKQLLAEQGTASKNVEQAATDLASAKNDLAVAEKQMALLKASPTPAELTQEQAKVQQAQAALETAKTQREMLTIKAPIDGTVVSLAVNPGESVDSTRTLVQLVALDRLWVDVDVPVSELPADALDLAAQMTAGTSKQDFSNAIAGKVTYVSPQVEPKNGAVMLGIDLPADTTLRPGQTVRVRIIAQEHKDVLAVPREAVVEDENHDFTVAVVSDENAADHTATAIKRTVKPGLEENGLMEIGTDLKEGTPVVTQGAYNLRTTEQSLQQTRVKVVE